MSIAIITNKISQIEHEHILTLAITLNQVMKTHDKTMTAIMTLTLTPTMSMVMTLKMIVTF